MLVDTPGLVVPEAVGGEARGLERAVTVAQGGPHTFITESDEVRPAVPGDV